MTKSTTPPSLSRSPVTGHVVTSYDDHPTMNTNIPDFIPRSVAGSTSPMERSPPQQKPSSKRQPGPTIPENVPASLLEKEQKFNLSLYKTELCRAYEEGRPCRFGEGCLFAHGRDQLRSVPRHPKYKTEICRVYHTGGACPYGVRCRFIHDFGEARTSWASAWQKWQEQLESLSETSESSSSSSSDPAHIVPSRSRTSSVEDSLAAGLGERKFDKGHSRALSGEHRLSVFASLSTDESSEQ